MPAALAARSLADPDADVRWAAAAALGRAGASAHAEEVRPLRRWEALCIILEAHRNHPRHF